MVDRSAVAELGTVPERFPSAVLVLSEMALGRPAGRADTEQPLSKEDYRQLGLIATTDGQKSFYS